MEIVGKNKEVLAEVLIGEPSKSVNAKTELRKEIRGMLKKDKNVKDYIALFEKFTGLSFRSSKLTEYQLNDLVTFCVSQQIQKENQEREKRRGILC